MSSDCLPLLFRKGSLRFLNGGVLRNLNIYSFQKLYPVCSAAWLRDAPKPKKFHDLSIHLYWRKLFYSKKSYRIIGTIYQPMLGSLQFLRHHSNCLFFPGTPGCSLNLILVHFTFEQYSSCTHIFHQMITLSNLAYKRDLCGTIWSVLANGKCLNRQGTSATNRVAIQIP